MFILVFFIHVDAIEIIESKYLLDKEHAYTIENIYEKKNTFLEFAYSADTFGYTDDTLWLYIKLKNTTNKDQSNVIKFLYALHDYIYVLEYKNSQVIDEYLTGDRTRFNTRKIDTNSIAIPYKIEANETKEFILKVNSKSNLSIGVNFFTREEFFSESKTYDMVSAGYYGACLIMLIYNLFLYLMIRGKVYLYYVLFHVFLLLSLLTSNGYAFTLLWPNVPDINEYFLPSVFALANYYSIRFAQYFLDLKRYALKLFYYFNMLLIIFISLFLSTFIVGYSVIELMLMFSVVSISSLMFTGLYILYKYRTIDSKFFAIAWSFTLLGAVMENLQALGILDMGFYVSYASQFGMMVELVLLSLALAYRYNLVFNKLVQTESEVRTLNESLQEKVDEQTKDLKLLIKETHHRVKNNFQFILTFLWAQKKSIHDEASIKALEQTTKRIHAIASLHELLNASGEVEINTKTYVEDIIRSFQTQDHQALYEFNIEKLSFNYDGSIAIGIIINELITNSIKYAFESIDKPHIAVELYEKDNKYIFKYCDNGVGFDVKEFQNSRGLGHDLIYGFIHKNSGDVSISSDSGMEMKIIFNKESLDEQ